MTQVSTLGARAHAGSPRPTCSGSYRHGPPVQTHPGVRDLELTQDILWHVVLGHRVNNKVLVASRALCWPVLVAFLLWTKGPPP